MTFQLFVFAFFNRILLSPAEYNLLHLIIFLE